MVIAIDFDGTCVSHRFPLIGEDIGAVPVLKALVAKNKKIDPSKKEVNIEKLMISLQGSVILNTPNDFDLGTYVRSLLFNKLNQL